MPEALGGRRQALDSQGRPAFVASQAACDDELRAEGVGELGLGEVEPLVAVPIGKARRTSSRSFDHRVRDAGLPRSGCTTCGIRTRRWHSKPAFIRIVQERLGRAMIPITLDTYSHAIPAMQEDTGSKSRPCSPAGPQLLWVPRHRRRSRNPHNHVAILREIRARKRERRERVAALAREGLSPSMAAPAADPTRSGVARLGHSG
jgi:hypothetical protein